MAASGGTWSKGGSGRKGQRQFVPASQRLPRLRQTATATESTVVRDSNVRFAERELFGRELSTAEASRLVGMREGAEIDLRDHPDGIEFVVTHPDVDEYRGRIGFANPDDLDDPSLVMVTDILKLNRTGTGRGTEMIADRIGMAEDLGITTFRAIAGGPPDNPHLNGSRTLPLLGYRAELTSTERDRLPPELAGVTNTHDLMQRPGGIDWWRANHSQREVEFDTRSGSVSRQVLDAYIANRRQR